MTTSRISLDFPAMLLLPLLLLVVLRGVVEAGPRLRRGTLLELHCRGPHRVLLVRLLQLWPHLVTRWVVPAGPVLVGACATLRRRELVLQLRRRQQLASSGRLILRDRVGLWHLDA